MDLNSGKTEASTILNSKLKQHPKELSKCTIYRLHRLLRDVNRSAYEPEVIAIGPYHRGKDHLKMMEDHKLHTLQVLVEREGCDIIETFAKAVGELESKARKCYADEDLKLSESEFIEMLVLDGCFIVELVRKFEWEYLREKDDPIFQMDWMRCVLQRDLMLFENQVPFFILLKLFNLIEDPNVGDCVLMGLLSNFFRDIYPGRGHYLREPHDGQGIMHLLDLIHSNWIPPPRSQEEIKEFQSIDCATRLTEANVKFKVKEEEATTTLFDIEFKDGVMVMAPLHIEDGTEWLLRNLIAYEQYFKKSPDAFVTHYMMFLDRLINSSKDVEILSQNGIITNWQGDDEVVANMVNRLSFAVTFNQDCFNYAKICEDVNEHCRKPKNKWMAKLR